VNTRAAIIFEKLTNIRKSWRKGNGKGRKMRGRLNRWCFRELQRQIDYKAKWKGLPVDYVWASKTSKTCSQCGYVNKALECEKCWTCPNCGVQHDRDYNAAKNILAKFQSRLKEAGEVRQSNEGLASEGMVLREAITRS
jgi:putative transposase